MGRLTVAEHLDQVARDLGRLVTECNRDGLHDVATRAQAALELVASIDPRETIPETATWPPRVTVNKDTGATEWKVAP